MLDEIREQIWGRAAEKYVVLPEIPIRPEEVGRLLADAFAPVLPFARGTIKVSQIQKRSAARRRLRELIEARLPINLP